MNSFDMAASSLIGFPTTHEQSLPHCPLCPKCPSHWCWKGQPVLLLCN